MTDVKITCTATGETFYEGPAWGANDALVNYYCDNSTPIEIYAACNELSNQIIAGVATYDLEAYLACEVEGVEKTQKQYEIVLEDVSENCDETYVNEVYDTYKQARARFEDLARELADLNSGWRDGVELWLNEVLDGVWSGSIDYAYR